MSSLQYIYITALFTPWTIPLQFQHTHCQHGFTWWNWHHLKDVISCFLQQFPTTSNKLPVKLWTRTIFSPTQSWIIICPYMHMFHHTISSSQAHLTKSLMSSTYLPMTNSLTPASANNPLPPSKHLQWVRSRVRSHSLLRNLMLIQMRFGRPLVCLYQ